MNNVANWISAARFVHAHRLYNPQRVSFKGFLAWIAQFSATEQRAIRALCVHLQFISAKDLESQLRQSNEKLLSTLNAKGVPPDKVIYVSHGDAASSATYVLHLLRDSGRLESRRCPLINGKDVMGLSRTTTRIGQGAIVYVDDFAGTGNQFAAYRDEVRPYIIGQFSEWFLVHTACEEALLKFETAEFETLSVKVHTKPERPLREESGLLNPKARKTLLELSERISKRGGLGYAGMATMVIFERNAPNTTPMILRGAEKQSTWHGILPRTTDLPAPALL